MWYSSLRGGAWISAAIDKYVFIFLNKTEDKNLIKASHGFEAIMSYDYKDIKNPIIKCCLEEIGIKKGVEILVYDTKLDLKKIEINKLLPCFIS